MARPRPTGGEFARSMSRAVAQRGRLEPLYRELSDHLTRILQRLYPVWSMIAPGLAEPGHIELSTRTIYLDSDALLGSRAEIVAGALDPRRMLSTFGVALHETMHAKHTKLWVSEYDAELEDDVLRADRRLLEEPRMEAAGCREFPSQSRRGRFVHAAIGACVVDVLVPVFLEETTRAAQMGQPVTRDACGRAMTYLHARTHYGVIDRAALAALIPVWEAVLGAGDVARLDALYARLIWIPDGENEALNDIAREYREIIGPPDPPPPSQGGEGSADGSGGGSGSGEGSGAGDGSAPGAGSLSEAIEDALEQAKAAQLEQLDEDADLEAIVAQAAREGGSAPRGGGGGTGRPGGRMPDRGVDRAPVPDEVAQARRFAQRLRRAQSVGTRTIDKRTPGGRFNARQHVRGRGQKVAGQPVTALPWQIRREITAPLEQPHVGLIIDNSGSMASFEYALGPVAWIIQDALRQVDGRCAIALFGDGMGLLSDGASPMKQVPGITTGGGTAFAGDAINEVCSHLDMESPRRPRFVYVLSDGGWWDSSAGVEKIRALDAAGVPTIHLSIGVEPLSVEASRISVITDPAEALDHVANDTVEALKGGVRGR